MTDLDYPEQLVTFFDVLGFQELLSTRQPEEVLTLLARLKSDAAPTSHSRELFGQESIVFSDCVVRSTPLYSEVKPDTPNATLYYELWSMGFAQCRVVYEHRAFLRGGISIGKFHLKNSAAFGPGLVDAYLIESKLAKYPRVVLSLIVEQQDGSGPENSY